VPADATPLSYVIYGDLSRARRGIAWEHIWRLQNLRESQSLNDYGDKKQTFTQLRIVLARAMEAASGWGGRLLFVYLPGEHRFTTNVARIESDAYRERVLAEVKGLGLAVIDLTPVFARHPWPKSLFHGHYSPAGNALVAEAVMTSFHQIASKNTDH